MFKTHITPALLFLTAVTQLPNPMAAQYDDLLIVEKRKDLAARTRLLGHLRKTIVTVNFTDATAKEVVEYLRVATGGKVNFILVGKSEDLPKTTLQLKAVRMAALMSLIQEQTDMRFTFNAGLVVLKPKDKVKEFTYLQMYDVRVAVMPVRNFKAPRLGIGLGEVEEAEEEEEAQPLLFSSERLEELLRNDAGIENWDSEGVSLQIVRGIVLCRQSVRGQEAVRRTLTRLGAIPAPRRLLRSRVKRSVPARKKPSARSSSSRQRDSRRPKSAAVADTR